MSQEFGHQKHSKDLKKWQKCRHRISQPCVLDTERGRHTKTRVLSPGRGSKYCAILGDFNLDLLKFETHNPTNEFINILSSFCFQPHILQPTRITDHSKTLIDNFFNSLEHFTISGNIIYDITDHLPNFLIFDKFSSLHNNVKLYKRDYSNFNPQDMINEFQSINWQNVFFPRTRFFKYV